LPTNLTRFEPRVSGTPLIRAAFFLTLLMLVQTANAERLQPPLELLYNPLNVLVSGKVDEINPQGRIVFARRKLLKLGRSEHARGSRSSLNLLLTALKNNDPQLQNLAAAQITMEPELLQRIEPTDLPLIKALIANDQAAPAARAILLVAANRHPEQLGREWPTEMALTIITTTPIDLNLTKSLDSGELVLSAFDMLATLSGDLPLASVTRWIGSANPGIAERALLIVRKQAPDQERAAIQRALDDSSLTPLTRQFLQDHLRRLNLTDEKVRSTATDSQKH